MSDRSASVAPYSTNQARTKKIRWRVQTHSDVTSLQVNAEANAAEGSLPQKRWTQTHSTQRQNTHCTGTMKGMAFTMQNKPTMAVALCVYEGQSQTSLRYYPVKLQLVTIQSSQPKSPFPFQEHKPVFLYHDKVIHANYITNVTDVIMGGFELALATPHVGGKKRKKKQRSVS